MHFEHHEMKSENETHKHQRQVHSKSLSLFWLQADHHKHVSQFSVFLARYKCCCESKMIITRYDHVFNPLFPFICFSCFSPFIIYLLQVSNWKHKHSTFPTRTNIIYKWKFMMRESSLQRLRSGFLLDETFTKVEEVYRKYFSDT